MAIENKNGSETYNARINIKYNKNKPDISFSYPNKKTQYRGSMIGWIRAYLMMLVVLFFVSNYIFNLFDTSYLGLSTEKTELEKFTQCAVLYPVETLTNYTDVRYNLCKPEKELEIVSTISILIFIYLFIYLFLPLIIYYPFRKKWDKLYPKHEGFWASKKLRIFNKFDIIERDGKIFVELPVFKNVVLNFKATKEFSDYMNELEIKEYKFFYLTKKLVRVGKKKKKFRKVNEWIWYARFYFDKRPTKGELRVLYK